MRITLPIPDGGSITLELEQALSFVALCETLEDEGKELESWHMCYNGCCLFMHMKGYDETEWRVSKEGTCELIDRYGNVLETMEPRDE